MNKIIIKLVSFIALISVIACGKKSKILVDGSSTVYPLTEAVAEEYLKTAPKVNLTIGVSGTGGGFKKFCAGEIDIANASRHIKASEIEICTKNKIEYLPFAIAYDGLSVVTSKTNTFINNLNVDQLKLIFDDIKHANTWKELNSSFPADNIVIYSPGQDSGTYDYFVEAIIGKNARVRNGATFSEDDNVLVTGVSSSNFAIGFFGLAYYEANKEKLKLIPIINPKTKEIITPNIETVRNGSYTPLSRKLFIYISKKQRSESEKKQVVDFVTYYLNNISKLSTQVGYIPLSDEDLKVEISKLNSL